MWAVAKIVFGLIATAAASYGGYKIAKATDKSGEALQQVVPPNATVPPAPQQGPEVKQRVQAARKVPRGPETPPTPPTPPTPAPKVETPRPSGTPGPSAEHYLALGRLFDRYGVNTALVGELADQNQALFGSQRGRDDAERLLRDRQLTEMRRA